MSRIVTDTIYDLQWGRQTWRVLLLITLPALGAGFAVGLVQ